MENINIASFSEANTATVKGIWQYDFGQILRIEGLGLPDAVEVHFSLQKTGGEAKRRIGVTKDGVTDVRIPDFILEEESSVKYEAYAFIYVSDRIHGNTTKKIIMEIEARPKPEAFNKPCEAEIFQDTIEAVRESMAGAEAAAELAEAWAHGHENHPENAEDNAKYYSDLADASRKATENLKSEVENMKSSVDQSKSNVAENLKRMLKHLRQHQQRQPRMPARQRQTLRSQRTVQLHQKQLWIRRSRNSIRQLIML